MEVELEESRYKITETENINKNLKEEVNSVQNELQSTKEQLEEILKNKRYIYPNPSSRSIKIQGIYKEQTYKIYNLIGAEVLRGSINFNENIEIHNLKKGLYFLKLKNGDAIKFIKK